MSRVYFHSPSGTAELHGSERAWLGGLVNDITVGILDVRSTGLRVDRLRELIHPDHHMARYSTDPEESLRWAASYETSFTVGWSDRPPLVQYADRPIDTFTLALNAALTVGNDAVKLAARLHGSCEIHAWVDGPNRAWLADIMQTGLDGGLYRPAVSDVDQGWSSVIDLLRSRDDEPVVTSYSVTDGFPNSDVGDWMPAWPGGVPRRWDALTEEQQRERSDRDDAWYELDDAEQWRISMTGLRASEEGLEMKPDNWDGFRFGHTLSVVDLVAPNWRERIETALGLIPVTAQPEREVQ